MRPVDRFEQAVACHVSASALGAVIDGEFAIENVGKQRHLMEVPAGFAARRDGNDRRSHHRRSRRVRDLLTDDGLVAGEDWRQQVLVLSRGCGGRCLCQSRRNTQRESGEKDRTGEAQITHAELH
jgi:hypothetical protein